MAAPAKTGETSAAPCEAFTGALAEVRALANDVGPAWGLILVVALCLFMPRLGVVVHLAQMFKEDRADARKQKVESERLLTRYRQRALGRKKEEP